MDFTSVKCMPIDWMLKYTDETCEVGGLHPLYGSVNSIKDRTIVYCSTERSDDRCETILDALKISGGKIYPMDAEQHDHVVNGILQSNRIKLFEAFIFSLSEAGLSFKDVYQLSSMPGRALLDLIARQADERNDGLYESMRDFNPFEDDLNHELTFCLKDAIEDYNPEKIRAFFGEDLKAAQERAKKLLS
jgi:prephenate dehydrogenase